MFDPALLYECLQKQVYITWINNYNAPNTVGYNYIIHILEKYFWQSSYNVCTLYDCVITIYVMLNIDTCIWDYILLQLDTSLLTFNILYCTKDVLIHGTTLRIWIPLQQSIHILLSTVLVVGNEFMCYSGLIFSYYCLWGNRPWPSRSNLT